MYRPAEELVSPTETQYTTVNLAVIYEATYLNLGGRRLNAPQSPVQRMPRGALCRARFAVRFAEHSSQCASLSQSHDGLQWIPPESL